MRSIEGADQNNSSSGGIASHRIKSKIVKPSATITRVCDEKSDGECSDDELVDHHEVFFGKGSQSNTRYNDEYELGTPPRRARRQQPEIDDKIRQEIIGETIAKTMRHLMEEGRLIMEKETPKRIHKFGAGNDEIRLETDTCEMNKTKLSVSELTIYERAVQDDLEGESESKRKSSSSEEAADTSDELVVLPTNKDMSVVGNGMAHSQNKEVDDYVNFFLGNVRRQVRQQDDVQPSTSGYRSQSNRTMGSPRQNEDLTPVHFANKVIKESEVGKAKTFEVPGKADELFFTPEITNKGMVHSILVDETYMSVGAHVDAATKQKIIEGQYIDFAKLIPKDKVLAEDDQKVQIVMRNGGTYFVPANEGAVGITSVMKWDQAFRVYADIYCKKHPCRSTELIQYSHCIHTAASAYIWENVYSYDKDFRLHMGENPGRNWSIILQQAWTMRLKDRLKSSEQMFYRQNKSVGNNGDGKTANPKDFCRRFNRGRCTFGSKCRYEHHCSYCFKFGHGYHNCRKVQADKKDRDNSGGGSSHAASQQQQAPK